VGPELPAQALERHRRRRKGGKGAFLIYQESSLVIRAIRDYFNHDIGDILIDTDDIYEQAQQFMAHVMPEHAARVKRYRDDAPLFSPLPDRAPDRVGLRPHGARCPAAAPS
jgi:Ribonuclease G/E